MTPRVSVIVPLFNKASTVRRALESIVRQTFADLEIIVVDDGSTDGGAAIAAELSDVRLRVIRQPNGGPGAARNRGIAAATAPLVAFLDADDEWLPEFLSRAVAVLDARTDLAAFVAGYLQGPNRRTTVVYWTRRGITRGAVRILSSTPAPQVVTLLAYMNPWATVARRSVVNRYGGFYEAGCRYGEDNYLWLQVVLNAGVWLESDALVHWHSEASDLSRNMRGPRPIEPFFTATEPLYAACPSELRALLHDVLAIRAAKTAAMLGFWGRWRDGRALLGKFCTLRDLRYRGVQIGQLAATPLGAVAGGGIRTILATLPRAELGSASLGRS